MTTNIGHREYFIIHYRRRGLINNGTVTRLKYMRMHTETAQLTICRFTYDLLNVVLRCKTTNSKSYLSNIALRRETINKSYVYA